MDEEVKEEVKIIKLNNESLSSDEFSEKKKELEEKKIKVVKISENVYKTKLYD